MKKLSGFILSFVCVVVLVQCSSSKFMPALSTFQNEKAMYQYNDSTIADAFKQNPQIQLPLKVAIYDVGFESISIIDSLQNLNSVKSVTHISPAMIEGVIISIGWQLHGMDILMTPKPTDPKELRTIAARSHSDVVLYFGTSHAVYTDTNLLGISYFALVPMLFMKGNTLEVKSYLDVHLIDVRNGFIYTSYRAKAESSDRFVKLNYEKDLQKLKDKNIQTLTNDLLKEISRTIEFDDLLNKEI